MRIPKYLDEKKIDHEFYQLIDGELQTIDLVGLIKEYHLNHTKEYHNFLVNFVKWNEEGFNHTQLKILIDQAKKILKK